MQSIYYMLNSLLNHSYSIEYLFIFSFAPIYKVKMNRLEIQKNMAILRD